MSIYNVSKADMIAWFKRNNQVDSILTFARLREMQRAMPESDRLIEEANKLRKQFIEAMQKAKQEPDREKRFFMMGEAIKLRERADELDAQATLPTYLRGGIRRDQQNFRCTCRKRKHYRYSKSWRCHQC